jgi:glycosyltransferase involved in cell wall biosynthesis
VSRWNAPLSDAATLVVLFYNAGSQVTESMARLEAFAARRSHWQFVFTDDASADDTRVRLVEGCARPGFEGRARVVSNERNLGKGGTLSHAVEGVQTPKVAFSDGDLPYDLEALDRFEAALEPGVFVLASRVHPDSRFVIDPSFLRYVVTRHFTSRLFNLVARLVLLPGVRDSQAGLKMFGTDELRGCLALATKTGFSFDLELLAIARHRGIRLEGLPVTFRYASESSTVRFARDGLNMFADLFHIRIRGLLGRYG